ncbi:hypothetical protein SPRG_19628 [Saprolegnia parasitica CBS 223.65]|uniref:Uncharacterized protein n=1 Tax=Saprolegnia parasitica (strain CBS 223.65) TaxID=695850 RepID=A0A067CKW1_SAPPC|nr:hypothetical protein SPRG_19628 [Saprolegnia parasitica CBS 223.65]KDO31163.1 hypothetical protein SPRG_19628 [Saprolegnia parasitica CBS 223.65]|eukprot:XP_012198351.1 hypothetical protein SPRG_19628 [Saprolegnia parasitica CBS 223.65]
MLTCHFEIQKRRAPAMRASSANQAATIRYLRLTPNVSAACASTRRQRLRTWYPYGLCEADEVARSSCLPPCRDPAHSDGAASTVPQNEPCDSERRSMHGRRCDLGQRALQVYLCMSSAGTRDDVCLCGEG